tara:strand:+ start:420 stop:596 length:177 start_codon:yes stop_codon:yes gene_type:complete
MASKLNSEGKFEYFPRTKKEKLIWEICKHRPHYTYGDNGEQLWNENEKDLEELLKEIK